MAVVTASFSATAAVAHAASSPKPGARMYPPSFARLNTAVYRTRFSTQQPHFHAPNRARNTDNDAASATCSRRRSAAGWGAAFA